MVIIRTISFMIFGLFIAVNHAIAAPPQLTEQLFESHPKQSVKELLDTSSIIVFGKIHSSYKKFDTNKTASIGKLYNYLQTMDVKYVFKGRHLNNLTIVSTGIEPLPKPENILNKRYPGPLANGQYIFFLQRADPSDIYYINGGWQGTYPYINGQVISLKHEGFNLFNGLTLKEFEQKINQLMRQ